MSAPGYRVRVVLAAAAVAVMSVEVSGWWWWQRLQRLASIAPTAAAEALRTSLPAALPPTVERSRRLATGSLAEAPRPLVVAALDRLGDLQRRWMPAHPVGFANPARSELLRGRVGDARVWIEKALARDPTSARLHRLSALAAVAQGDLEPGVEALATAEAIAPGLRAPPVQLTAEDERRARLRALELTNRYYPRRGVANALALARAVRAEGRNEAARELLAAHVADPEVQLELARWALDDGALGEAESLLGGVIDNRAYPRALRSRGWSMMAIARDLMGDAPGALAAADQALALDPGSPQPWVTLARLAESRGELEAALGHLRRAWGMAPTDVRLLTHIAQVAERAGRPADALLALERAVEVDPQSPATAARLVSLQIRQGRYAEAAIAVSRALDRHPTDPVLLELTERLRREIGPG